MKNLFKFVKYFSKYLIWHIHQNMSFAVRDGLESDPALKKWKYQFFLFMCVTKVLLGFGRYWNPNISFAQICGGIY